MEVGPSHNFASALLPENDSCWKFRTRFEKLLLFAILIVVIFSVIIVAFVAFIAIRMANSKGNNEFSDYNFGSLFYHNHMSINDIQHNQHDMSMNYVNSLLQNGSKVCLSSGCVKAASELLHLLDESVSPCDDFYSFVCGGWIKSVTIPEDSGVISMFDESRLRLDIQLKALVEGPDDNSQISAVTMMKNMYKSCMNLSAIEQYGMNPLQESLKSFGGWPVIEDDQWKEEQFDWIDTIAKMRAMGFGVNMFIHFKVIADVSDNTKNIIHMDEPVLGMRKQIIDEGLNSTILMAYYRLMIDSAVMLGAKNITKIEKQMQEVIELERELSNYMHDPNLADTKHAYYVNLTPLVDTPNYNNTRLGSEWIRYINAVLQLHNGNITKNDTIITDNVHIIENVDVILAYLNQNNRRLLANYILWRVVLQSLGSGNKSMREMRKKLYEDLYGVTERPPRWKICLSQLGGGLSMALSSLYIKHHFDEKSKTIASNMVSYMNKEFTNMLKEVDWMDEHTRNNALIKAKLMRAIVGYPSELNNHSLINEHYEGLNLTAENFEYNLRRLTKWSRDKDYNILTQKNSHFNWKKYADTAKVNAFYQPQANSIVIPAGILRDTFFDAERPQYLNFGTIGYIIGHEITHGFDNVGSHFDEKGNARNWWHNDTFERYNRKAECMTDQYNKFILPDGHKVNGQYTLKENIADNGAVKEAFYAYLNYIQEYGEELALPGLKYSPRQLFWIAAAKNWCSKSTPQMFKTRLETDNHSPGQARVNVVMSNLKEFSQSFNCPSGSMMNPKVTCTVW